MQRYYSCHFEKKNEKKSELNNTHNKEKAHFEAKK